MVRGGWISGLRNVLKAKLYFVSTYITLPVQLFMLNGNTEAQLCKATKA